jgi:hypothetical protein
MQRFTSLLSQGGRRPGARPARIKPHRPHPYRPHLETLEERLPPGDTILGALLAQAWTEPASLISNDAIILAPEGRPSLARGVSPWEAIEQSFIEPRRGGSTVERSESLSPFQGSGSQQLPDSQGSRPALPTVAPPGLADEIADWIASNPARQQRAPMQLPPADLHGLFHTTDTGYGFTGLIPTQRFWVPPSLPAGESTRQDVRLPVLPLELVGDTDSQPAVSGGGVHALFNLDVKTEAPFPTNVFTVPDHTQNTGRRVNLPLPDCKVYVSDCEDSHVLNELDGFNMQPRLSIPFDGPIDVHSVTSQSVFLVSLGDTLNHHDHGGQVVGINQVVWDVATTTLHVESDELLDQHTRYALIVTNGIHDTSGNTVEATETFRNFRHDVRGEYKHELLDAIHAARQLRVRESNIVAASVFTTQSATAILEKIRDQIHAATPAPADFLLGPGGTRTVFPLDRVTGITWNQQTGDDPPAFTTASLRPDLLRVIPGVVGELAYGKYVSPDYEVHPGEYIPQVPTHSGTPAVQGMSEVYFQLALPSGPKPAGGWPVAIFGQGLPSGGPGWNFPEAASMAEQGIATISIAQPGGGFGPLSTLTVNRTPADGGPVTFLAGGRGRDQDGDHAIGNTEGAWAARPQAIIYLRDTQRQMVADLMQLVREIEVGMDVDGDGTADLDSSRIYYFGQSFGGIYGTEFLAVEPDVRTGVLNVGGGSVVEDFRLHPNVRLVAQAASLAARVPSVINAPGVRQIDGVAVVAPYYNENLPLRDGVPLHVLLEDGTSYDIRSPVINAVPGAMAIQEVVEHMKWVTLSGDPLAFVPHLRREPLAGVPTKSVIFQFAKGDQNVLNPFTTALLRAGDLADRATYYRHDLAFAEEPRLLRNPHGFLAGIANPAGVLPLEREISLGAQAQIAIFFVTDGMEIIHPEPARLFETPIHGPLPEGLNYIPDP